jgi:thermitase
MRSGGSALSTLPRLGIVLLLLATGFPLPATGIGSSPTDPIPFNLAAASIPVSIPGSGEVWVQVTFLPSSAVSHMDLETEGQIDTTLTVFANLEEALQEAPIAEDDNGGIGLNASLRVPLGFPSPYLVRITGNSSGASRLRGDLTRVAADRCNWPAGCSLTVAAQEEPTASAILGLLREVRSEVLMESQPGRRLIDLYWRLSADLIPDLVADSSFRRTVIRQVIAMLPLARDAVEATRGTGGRSALSNSDLDRLHGLLDLLAARVSPQLAIALRSRWNELGLVERVGRPLADVLAETGLLPGRHQPHTVIARLRGEPRLDTRSGRPRLRTGDPDLDALLVAAGARALRRVYADSPAHRAAGLTRTIAFEVEGLAAARALAAELAAHPSVRWAQVSEKLWALSPAGTDPFRDDLWGLDAIRAPQAWASTTGSCSTPVAVVDTGLRSGLADLEGRILSQLGYDFVDDDPDPEDGHGHGTHVSGTIASALNNSISIAGVAPEICLFAVRVLGDDGSGTAEGVAAGIVHAADAGARVINLSLGCDCDTQQVIEEALQYASSRDAVVVAAAGNDSVDHLGYPASSPLTIAVGAVDRNLELASFSNHGPGLDLVAPGVDVVSLFRDGESCTGSGTSMATPHVSGAAALVRSVNSSLDRNEVRDLLRHEARDLGDPGYDTLFGAGLVDARAAVEAAGSGPGAGQCTPSPTALCLSGGRFRVEASWRRASGATGQGKAVRLTPDTGYFWFFDSFNVEVLVKVLNACGGASHRFWVFAGGLTNVEVRMRVTDTVTGQFREYLNPLNTAFQPIQDTSAFATCSSGQVLADPQTLQAPPAPRVIEHSDGTLTPRAGSNTCAETPTAMCLANGRFLVEARWRRPNGATGQATAVRLTPDTGYLWFFDSSNVEAVVKVLDACGSASHRFWVFAGGLTNVEVRIRVTDTVTGQFREYLNPLNTAFQPIQDTSAFATCR